MIQGNARASTTTRRPPKLTFNAKDSARRQRLCKASQLYSVLLARRSYYAFGRSEQSLDATSSPSRILVPALWEYGRKSRRSARVPLKSTSKARSSNTRKARNRPPSLVLEFFVLYALSAKYARKFRLKRCFEGKSRPRRSLLRRRRRFRRQDRRRRLPPRPFRPRRSTIVRLRRRRRIQRTKRRLFNEFSKIVKTSRRQFCI